MLTIRLSRVGSKNDSSFRVIVVDSKRKPQPGKYLEMVGSYDPRVNRANLKADRIKHWMSHGAQVSDTVHNLLVSQKIIDAKKINILPKFVAPEKPAEPVPSASEGEAKAEAKAEAPAEPMGEPVAETTEEKAAGTETTPPTEENPVATEEPQA